MGRRGGGRWGPAEDDAFLEALAEHGHAGRAAAAVGWTSRTAYERRRAAPAFAARWDALRRPPEPRRACHVRPARVGAGGTPARPMFVRGQNSWTDEIEADFLDTLASTCNVRLSAEVAGIGSNAVYRRRREHPEFERRWNAALAQGYARLEIELVRAAAESVEGVEFQERMIGPVSAETAIKLLGLHRAAVTGQGKRPGVHAALPPIEEVRERLRRHAEAVRAAHADGG